MKMLVSKNLCSWSLALALTGANVFADPGPAGNAKSPRLTAVNKVIKEVISEAISAQDFIQSLSLGFDEAASDLSAGKLAAEAQVTVKDTAWSKIPSQLKIQLGTEVLEGKGPQGQDELRVKAKIELNTEVTTLVQMAAKHALTSLLDENKAKTCDDVQEAARIDCQFLEATASQGSLESLLGHFSHQMAVELKEAEEQILSGNAKIKALSANPNLTEDEKSELSSLRYQVSSAVSKRETVLGLTHRVKKDKAGKFVGLDVISHGFEYAESGVGVNVSEIVFSMNVTGLSASISISEVSGFGAGIIQTQLDDIIKSIEALTPAAKKDIISLAKDNLQFATELRSDKWIKEAVDNLRSSWGR